MTSCENCAHRTDECPDRADGALVALGPFWGAPRDRDCPLELARWREEADRALKGR